MTRIGRTFFTQRVLIFGLRNLLPVLIFLLAFLSPALFAGNESLPKTVYATHAGVASVHVEASRAGVEILRAGGNAADAATAVAMALAVVYPQAGNLGGGGFLLYYHSGEQPYVLDFRETAPGAAHHDMYLNEKGELQEEKSRIGGLAVGVPGTVRGFYHFQKKFGKLPWAAVLQPAIRLAEEGLVADSFWVKSFRADSANLVQFPSTRITFFPGGKLPRVGEVFRQKNLARTLKNLALHGDRPFYEGEIAREIVKAVRLHGGILSLQDLENYRVKERQPLCFYYRGFTICSVPPPSSGGVLLSGMCNALSEVDLSRYPFHSPRQIALFAEIEKHYFALRNHFLGDPDFVSMPLEKLLSPRLAHSIVQRINIRKPVPARRIFAPRLLALAESKETTHFSVVDSAGNAVSVTYTLNGNFGSRLVAGSTGILLNNEMDDFAAQPGKPNMFGLVQGEANSIAPGKRMLSSMSPVIVLHNGNLKGVLGSPGGPTIITTVLQVLVHLIDYRLPLPDAVAAGRFHHQWLPDSLYCEKNRFPPDVLKTLEQWGYAPVKRSRLGNVQAIWKQDNGWLLCSDPRGHGHPAGF